MVVAGNPAGQVGNHYMTATFEAYLQHGHFWKQAGY